MFKLVLLVCAALLVLLYLEDLLDLATGLTLLAVRAVLLLAVLLLVVLGLFALVIH